MSKYTEEDLAGLTDEEREALLADDESDGESGEDDNDDKDGQDESKDKDSGDGADDDATGADDENASKADDDNKSGDEGDEGKDEPAPEAAPAPLLNAQPPADAEERLTAIAKSKADLVAQFDDGEITAKEHHEALDKLNKEERKIEREIDRAEIAADMLATQNRNMFVDEAKRFMTETGVYMTSQAAYNALDAAVKLVGKDPASATLTARQIMDKAHQEVLKDPIFANAFTAKPAKEEKPGKKDAKKPELPPTLGKLPSAEITDTGNSKWAALERLLKTDPDAHEDAVMKMSDSEREAYLASQ